MEYLDSNASNFTDLGYIDHKDKISKNKIENDYPKQNTKNNKIASISVNQNEQKRKLHLRIN